MSEPKDLPGEIPGTVTLDELRGIVGGFGFKLAIIPKEAPPAPIGFAAKDEPLVVDTYPRA